MLRTIGVKWPGLTRNNSSMKGGHVLQGVIKRGRRLHDGTREAVIITMIVRRTIGGV